MNTEHRQREKQRAAECVQVLRDTVFDAAPERSVEQLAAALSYGTDDRLGVGVSTLYKAVHGDRNFPLVKLPALVDATGDTRLLTWLAATTGHVLVKCPTGKAVDLQQTARLVREFGDLLKALADAQAVDGDGGEMVTRAEFDLFSKEAQELMESVEATRMALQEQVGMGPGNTSRKGMI